MSFDTDDILEVRDLEPPADSLPPKRFREGLHNYGGVRYFIGRHPPPSCPRGGGDDDDEDEVLTHPLNTYSQPLLTQLINIRHNLPLHTVISSYTLLLPPLFFYIGEPHPHYFILYYPLFSSPQANVVTSTQRNIGVTNSLR